jgi:hypothetical protein
MDVPTAVETVLGEDPVTETVPLKGEDALYLTPTRTIHYSAESFLKDESVETYPHDAERITVEEARRKAAIELDYGTDGTRSISVPKSSLEAALEPILASVLEASGPLEPEESVAGTFRFGELTLVVTDRRLIKHVGAAVYDEEYVEVPYEDVTGLSSERGNVASQLVLTTPDRTVRVKTPNEGFRRVDETVQEALYEYYDVDSVAEFEAAVTPEEEADEESPAESDETEPEAAVEFVAAGGVDRETLESELDALESALDEQEATLEAQRAAIEEQRDRIAALREELDGGD